MDNRPTTSPLTVSALIIAVAFVSFALILHHGLTSAADRLSASIDNHAQSVSAASDKIGPPVAKSLDALSSHVDQHANTLKNPLLTFKNQIDVKQPVTIQGPREDRSLPVNATLGK